MPSGVQSFSRCQAFTAASVPGPKSPSAETPPFGVLGEGEKEISSAEQLPLGPEAIEAWNAKIKELQDKVARGVRSWDEI